MCAGVRACACTQVYVRACAPVMRAHVDVVLRLLTYAAESVHHRGDQHSDTWQKYSVVWCAVLLRTQKVRVRQKYSVV